MNKRFHCIEEAIKKGGEISPFLFLSSDIEILHHELEIYIKDILQKNGIDMQSLFHLPDLGENLKISEVKKFLAAGEVRPRYAFQIFFIENISRMTTQAQNACLKFFEEPGNGNIVILSSESRSGILDTILSRVTMYEIHGNTSLSENNFFYSLIDSYVSEESDEIIRYFFPGKYEKDEYIHFLITLLSYIGNSNTYTHLLDQIHEDIDGIKNNNLQGKYVVDKYITLLKN